MRHVLRSERHSIDFALTAASNIIWSRETTKHVPPSVFFFFLLIGVMYCLSLIRTHLVWQTFHSRKRSTQEVKALGLIWSRAGLVKSHYMSLVGCSNSNESTSTRLFILFYAKKSSSSFLFFFFTCIQKDLLRCADNIGRCLDAPSVRGAIWRLYNAFLFVSWQSCPLALLFVHIYCFGEQVKFVEFIRMTLTLLKDFL